MMKNQSGLADPTAEAAISNILLKQYHTANRPLVYICISDPANAEEIRARAIACCRYAVDLQRTPFVPQLYFPLFVEEPTSEEAREIIWQMSRQVLKNCRELWWFGETPTERIKKEVKAGVYYGLEIRHFTLDGDEIPISA